LFGLHLKNTLKAGRFFKFQNFLPFQALDLGLVEWTGRKERTYQETMDAWRTSCPRFPVWEDATDRRLVETASANGRLLVRATPAGLAFLKEKRPHAYEELQQGSSL
jgi:hypothetical protein